MISKGQIVKSPENGSLGEIVEIFPSGNIRVVIVKPSGWHKVGDHLVWPPLDKV